MSAHEDIYFINHEIIKRLQDGILEASGLSSFTREELLEDLNKDLNENPILSISSTSKFSLYSTGSARTLIVWKDTNEKSKVIKVLNQWWKDPSIRKIVNVGSIPSFAINASKASHTMMDIAGYTDRLWIKYFGSYNKTRMAMRSCASLTFANLALLKFAAENMDNRGLPYSSLADMDLCKRCGYPDEESPHHHERESLVCIYPICDKKQGHLVRVCGVLQGLCYECGEVGHMARSHKQYRSEFMMRTYKAHKSLGVLSGYGLEIFARRKAFLSQHEFDPMAINNTSSSYPRKKVSLKHSNVLEIIMNGEEIQGLSSQSNDLVEDVDPNSECVERESLKSDDSNLSYIWEKKCHEHFNLETLFDYSLPSFFSDTMSVGNSCL